MTRAGASRRSTHHYRMDWRTRMVAPDYTAVLADLKERRAKLDAAIEVIEQMVASGDLVGVGCA